MLLCLSHFKPQLIAIHSMKINRHDTPRASNKEIFGWAMFDFANQAYTLLIITVIFPVFFTTVIVGEADQDFRLGNLLWSVSLAVSYFMVVLSGPVLVADRKITRLNSSHVSIAYA